MTPRTFCTASLLLAVAACQPPPAAPVGADASVRADCRMEVDRQYNAQNRVDLTRRDERDYAFAGSYNSGISSRGLSSEYQRDNMIRDCLRANGSRGQAAPGVGPAFTPAARGTGGSSLTP